jgi:hypothetical protein
MFREKRGAEIQDLAPLSVGRLYGKLVDELGES